MLQDLLQGGVLGRTVANIYTIEFQKRGLPHAYILIILHPDDKLRTADDYDKVVSAELPDPAVDPALYQVGHANRYNKCVWFLTTRQTSQPHGLPMCTAVVPCHAGLTGVVGVAFGVGVGLGRNSMHAAGAGSVVCIPVLNVVP